MPVTTLTAPPERPAALSSDELRRIDAWWRAANYLSVGQIYLYANPLLTEPLRLEHIKPRLLGHWGTTPGLNFIYVHCNRVIRKYDLDLSLRQPAAHRAAAPGAHQAAPAGPLGHHPWPEFHLRSLQSRHPQVRSRHDLHLRSRPRRPRHGGQYLARRHLQRDLPEYQPRCRGDATALHPVLVSGWHS